MKPQPVQFLMLYADVEGNIHLENDKGLFAINLMSEKKDEVVPHTEVSLSCYQTDGTRHFLGNDKQKLVFLQMNATCIFILPLSIN